MLTSRLKTLAILGTLSAIVIGVGALLGTAFLIALSVAALALSTTLYLRSDGLLLWLHRAQPLRLKDAPRLHRTIGELAREAGVPKPRLFRIADQGANAFAVGRNPRRGAIAVTDGLLETLSEREVRAVLAHELAHLERGDTLVGSVTAGLGTAFAFALHTLLFSFVSRSQDKETPTLAPSLEKVLVPVLAPLLRLGTSRRRELDADARAVELTRDPAALRSALTRLHFAAVNTPTCVQPTSAALCIVNPRTSAGLPSWLSTHPPIADRIRRIDT